MSRKFKNPVLIDLFSGCGGFSLGAHRAGFQVASAFDIDPILTSSYNLNYPKTNLYLRDVSKLTGEDLCATTKGQIFGIFGGPPCQGFSSIGKRDPSDPRRLLLGHFFRLVSEVKPAFFVMENVVGLGNQSSIEMLRSAISLLGNEYSILGPCIWDAAEFGAATKRSRLFVIGIHKGYSDPIAADEINNKKTPPTTVRDAIEDLTDATFEDEQDGFDFWKISQKRKPTEYAKAIRSSNLRFSGHRVTCHSEKVMKRFSDLPQGSIDEIGRHPRLQWEGQCPTLRAGTGSDRGSYQSVRPVHPDLPRVITIREAARIQGFPDDFLFHPTVWHSFRMIGNSVSPIMSEAIFSTLKSRLLPSG